MFRKKLRRGAKLQMVWEMQEAALDFVIAALEKIRETSDRLPRASRLWVERLRFAAPNKADLLAPIRERVRICTKCPHLASSRTQTVFGVGNPDANILKCRPDTPPGSFGNRTPTPLEMQTCRPYLVEQIEIIQPKVLVALGAVAVEGLLGSRGTMRELRGRWHSYSEDMLQVLERLERPITEKQRNYFL